jgi:hypothetical protein
MVWQGSCQPGPKRGRGRIWLWFGKVRQWEVKDFWRLWPQNSRNLSLTVLVTAITWLHSWVQALSGCTWLPFLYVFMWPRAINSLKSLLIHMVFRFICAAKAEYLTLGNWQRTEVHFLTILEAEEVQNWGPCRSGVGWGSSLCFQDGALMLHPPEGTLCSHREEGRRAIRMHSLFKPFYKQHLIPVMSDGLITC